MSTWRRGPSPLPEGVYDEVVSDALARRLDLLRRTHTIQVEDLARDADVDEQLVALIRDATRIALGATADSRAKVEIARQVLSQLGAGGLLDEGETALQSRLLLGVSPLAPGTARQMDGRPRGSLLTSGLITNAHGDSVLSHLASEFSSADRIDLLCSFIKLSGLDKFRPLIERHRALGRPLRVLTTTYMRATEVKAIELLHRLGAEVRISYDDSSTRLHAKAWMFHRDSEYSTAYVGSSNLSHAAQTEGLEWNVRIAKADQPDLLEEMQDVFESYWCDRDRFEPFDGSPGARARLQGALAEPERRGDFFDFELEPKDWQKPILRELEQARALGRSRNLVVAATGTGKTLIAAFDYERLLRRGEVDTLLFVAHRKEILEQSRRVFRQVLRLERFGELWVDGQRPTDFRHVFASVQSLAQADDLGAETFHHVIVDEVHHAAARSYATLLDRLRPRQLVGLTATPERADGRLYERHFPPPYIGNLRVWDAIQQQVLVPFRYFVLDVEGFDLADARWEGGYVDADLSGRLVSAQDLWVRSVTRAIGERIARPTEVRALAFCVDKAHARVVADRLGRDAHLVARALTDDTPREERDRARQDLMAGKVQVLCVVDLFNEGVDIPDVNTLFLFRPTESATVFLQQLGRGLRRSRHKDILTVLDVTGRQHPSFRFDRQLRALLGHTPRELREFLETGFGRLRPAASSSSRSRRRRTSWSGSSAPSPRIWADSERSSRRTGTTAGTSPCSCARPRPSCSTSTARSGPGPRCAPRLGSRPYPPTRRRSRRSPVCRSCSTSATRSGWPPGAGGCVGGARHGAGAAAGRHALRLAVRKDGGGPPRRGAGALGGARHAARGGSSAPADPGGPRRRVASRGPARSLDPAGAARSLPRC
ncbi:MAG: DEAD/DEAH box helicase family protein [Methylotenera sp.]